MTHKIKYKCLKANELIKSVIYLKRFIKTKNVLITKISRKSLN